MAVNHDSRHVLKVACDAWRQASFHMRKINSAARIRQDPLAIFRVAQSDLPNVIKLDIAPVVINVPERRDTPTPNLYIVIRGWLAFDGPDFHTLPLHTNTFGTEMAYFRQGNRSLEHVYGVHFDMDEDKAGHPVFHAQMSAKPEFVDVAYTVFRLKDPVENKVGTPLGTVRVPCAQMDVFSALTQICADHLLSAKSGEDDREQFRGLRKACDFFLGAAHRLAYLNEYPAIHCYRSTHWYKSPQAQ